jgi:hypothetical protein
VGLVEDYTDPYRSTFTRVPPVGPGVCDICHSAPWYGATCNSCRSCVQQVSRPTRLVVPISLCQIPSQLYAVLRDYKGSRAKDLPQYELRIAALLHRFLERHGRCISTAAGIEWDILTAVPSTRHPGPHAMEGVIAKSAPLLRDFDQLLQQGPTPMVNRIAADDVFATTKSVTDQRVLIIEDTFVTGARVQSAASCLSLAGAEVVGAVTVGRIVRPESSAEAATLWQRANEGEFDFDVCCLER